MIEAVWGSNNEPKLNASLERWASVNLFGHDRGFGPCTAMGVFEDGNLIAVTAFHNWEPEAGVIELSAFSEKKEWLKRPILFGMFSYTFDYLKCQMVVMRTSERNQQWNGRGINRILKAYGFSSIRIPRLYGRHEDGIFHSLTEESWRANGFHRKSVNISHRSKDTVAA